MTTTTIDIAGHQGRRVSLTPQHLDDLDSQVEGPVLSAGEEGWGDAVLLWNDMVTTDPALVLQPTSAHDVAAAVGLARDHGLLLSIKGGGHNIAGTAIAEGAGRWTWLVGSELASGARRSTRLFPGFLGGMRLAR